MEEITIEFVPEITEDILKGLISKTTIDFIINYEDGVLTLDELNEFVKEFVSLEYYNYAEAVTRALKAIDIIFK